MRRRLASKIRRSLLVLSLISAGCSSCFDRAQRAKEPARATEQRAPAPAAAQEAPKRVRPAAVAGSWYPGEREALARDVDALIAKAPAAQVAGKVIALVSPHAGYQYSGKAAATGFKLLRGQRVRRVIALGVAHRARVAGAAVTDATHYATPLGEIPLDVEAATRLQRSPVVALQPTAHEGEHSIEMQLPLLQRIVPGFTLLPLVVGQMEGDDFAKLAAALAEELDGETIVVASSDFTHRGPSYSYEVPAGPGTIEQRLRRVDQGAVDRILARDRAGLLANVANTGATICGLRPFATLLELLGKAQDPKGEVVSHYTSADVAGDWKNSVTYVDVVFTGAWPETALHRARSAGAASFPLSTAEQQRLLKLARASLEASVRKGAFDPDVLRAHGPAGASLTRKAGAFVTLKCRTGSSGTCSGKGDGLRGCIGTIGPDSPVFDTVARRAASAALEDPRFPRVTAPELSQISVEVSVLTPPRTVAGPQEIVVGRHGIILEHHGRSATFLPQVAPEQGWDRDTTLEHLNRKAGLPPGTWRTGARFQVYEAIVVSEHKAH